MNSSLWTPPAFVLTASAASLAQLERPFESQKEPEDDPGHDHEDAQVYEIYAEMGRGALLRGEHGRIRSRRGPDRSEAFAQPGLHRRRDRRNLPGNQDPVPGGEPVEGALRRRRGRAGLPPAGQGSGKAAPRADDQVDGQKKDQDQKPEGMEDIEKLKLLQEGGHARGEAGGELRRRSPGNHGAAIAGRDRDQEKQGQLHGGKEGVEGRLRIGHAALLRGIPTVPRHGAERAKQSRRLSSSSGDCQEQIELSGLLAYELSA